MENDTKGKVGLDDYLCSHTVNELLALPRETIETAPDLEALLQELSPDSDPAQVERVSKIVATVNSPVERERISKDVAKRTGLTLKAIRETLAQLQRRRAVGADGQGDGGDKASATAPYRIENGAFCRERSTNVGLVVEPLCNFTAQIVEEVILDDGAEMTRAFAIQGNLRTGQPLMVIRVPAARFSSMAWVTENWGVPAVVHAGFTVRDQLREAIQKFSVGAHQRHIYTHTGWIKVGDEYVYLTASGAIGQDGYHEGFEVELAPELTRYSLPSNPQDPKAAMQFSLRLLDIAPLTITAPLWAGIFRAPLASAYLLDILLWLEGPTGSLKSTLLALFTAHYGHFERTSLPGTWSSTANQLEHRAFVLKDCVFPVDDYAPTPFDAREYAIKASRLVRSHGNLSGRGRCRSDMSERPSYFPRGLVISTGEQHPSGQASILARMLAVEAQRELINMKLLSEAQRCAEFLPHAMAGYIRWLAPQMATLPSLLKKTFKGTRQRTTAEDEHLRVPEALAHLWVGLDCALRYAEEIGACTQEEAQSYRVGCWKALLSLGRAQGRLVEDMRPSRRFLEGLASLLTQRKAVLLPEWDAGNAVRPEIALIGWYNDDFVYLMPEAAFSAVVRFCNGAGAPFPIHEQRLRRDLAQEKLTECDLDRHTKMVRVGGRNRRTLCLRRRTVEALLGEDLPCGVSTVSSVSGSGGQRDGI